MAETITFTLNSRGVSTPVEDGETLLDVLRERFGVTSPKNGCQPQAACGCCTVLVDGKPLLSCVLPAAKVGGRQVVTNEGLPAEVRERVAECFVRAGAVQCGFCIPGIVMRTVALADKNPAASREQIAHELRAHLCRCTGYVKIIDAIELYAAARRMLDLGPSALVVKKGEHGAVLVTARGVFVAPAFPLESVLDPTGAGDSFAGGFLGYLAGVGEVSPAAIRRGMIHGSAVASFAVEAFSVRRLVELRADELQERYEQFRELTAFETAG